ncbi:hypothetical protein LSH36_20g00075 [Paralvinella palmiformis]|uniref:Uncharacterized protein n=1 Tax=Paralvinella palmiformis TaxID=53620 RepID=A0AAD9KAH0_9ANNE|nr:hypothetical protein LSH36_20g00075 [Paralvinella palmiformis]
MALNNARQIPFASDEQLQLLAKAKTSYMDAAFKLIRKPFIPMFSVPPCFSNVVTSTSKKLFNGLGTITPIYTQLMQTSLKPDIHTFDMFMGKFTARCIEQSGVHLCRIPTQVFDTTVPDLAQIVCALLAIKCYLVHISHGRCEKWRTTSKDDDVLSIVSLSTDSSVCTTAVCGIKVRQKRLKTIWCFPAASRGRKECHLQEAMLMSPSCHKTV